ITHSEPFDDFVPRYRERAAELRPLLEAFGPAALRDWIHDIGIETFVGTSGRVFPREMKAAPLLRAWLARLRTAGVRFHPRHRWSGWPAGTPIDPRRLHFQTPQGPLDRKSTRLNSSHVKISYAVFCLKKKIT